AEMDGLSDWSRAEVVEPDTSGEPKGRRHRTRKGNDLFGAPGSRSLAQKPHGTDLSRCALYRNAQSHQCNLLASFRETAISNPITPLRGFALDGWSRRR